MALFLFCSWQSAKAQTVVGPQTVKGNQTVTGDQTVNGTASAQNVAASSKAVFGPNLSPTDTSSLQSYNSARIESYYPAKGIVAYGDSRPLVMIHCTNTLDGMICSYIKQSRSADGLHGGGGLLAFESQLTQPPWTDTICTAGFIGHYGAFTGYVNAYADDLVIAAGNALSTPGCQGNGNIRFATPTNLPNGNPYALAISPDGSIFTGGDNTLCIGGYCQADARTANASMIFGNLGTTTFRIKDVSDSAAGKNFYPLQWTKYAAGVTYMSIGYGTDAATGSVLDVNGSVTAVSGYKVNGVVVIPNTTTGYHGNGAKLQMSDNTGTTGNIAKFDANGNTSDGGGTATATGTGNLIRASVMPLSGTTGSIGGTALAAGACATGTATISGAVGGAGMVAVAQPSNGNDPGAGMSWKTFISSNGTVTVNVCAAVAGTPIASTYYVKVIQ